ITSAAVELGGFDAVIVDDDVTDSKPDPAGLRKALALLDADPDDTIYVGDTMGDMRAAAGAGVQGV
ncbi:MAG: HAD-IA family hydrolase, partial [Gammaproteobacteria bacterium]|nr:HAD-IA family hydrolase [Gemmatimonadota bacterium]NIU75881.1 HAD-IA family hydrolase [Gammaproteobacteria bacterium]